MILIKMLIVHQSTTLFTPDPAEYVTTLNLQINNTTLPTNREPTILGLTLDPKLTYNKQLQKSTQKDNKHPQSTHLYTMGKTKRNTHHHIHLTSSRIRQHNLVPHSIQHKHSSHANSTKHRPRDSNWLHTRHQHTTPT